MANNCKTYSKNNKCDLKINKPKNGLLTKNNSKENEETNANETIEDVVSIDSSHSLIVLKQFESEFDKLWKTKNYQPVGFKQITEPLCNSSMEMQDVNEEKVQEKKKIIKKKRERIGKTREFANAKWLSESINNSLEIENPNNEASNLLVINSTEEHELSNLNGIKRMLPSSTPFVKSYRNKFVNESLSPISSKYVNMKRVVFEQSYCSIEITHDESNKILPNSNDIKAISKLDMRPYIKIERLPDEIINRKTICNKVDDQMIHIKPLLKNVPLDDFETFATSLMQTSCNVDNHDEDDDWLSEENPNISLDTSGTSIGINESPSIAIPIKRRKFCKGTKHKFFKRRTRSRLLKELDNSDEWNMAKELRNKEPDMGTCSKYVKESYLINNKDLYDSKTVDCYGNFPTTSNICNDNDQSSSEEFPSHRMKYKRNYKRRLRSVSSDIEIEYNTGEELQIDQNASEITDTRRSCFTIDSSSNLDGDIQIKSEFCETPTVVENCDDILDSYTNNCDYNIDKFVVTRRNRIYNISMKNEYSNDASLLYLTNTDKSIEIISNISESDLPKDRFVFTRRRNGTAMSMPIDNPFPDDTCRNIDVEGSVSCDNTSSKYEDHSYANAINVDDSNIVTDQQQTSVVNNTEVNNTHRSEEDDKVDVFLVPKRFQIKPGKSWRRSMAFSKRTSIAFDLSSNHAIENVLGSFSLRKQLLDLSVCRQSVIKFIPKSPKAVEATGSSQDDGYEPINKTTNASVVNPPVANSKTFTEETALDQLLQLSVRHSKRFSLHPRLEFVSARDLVLRRCGQNQPLPFEECFPDSLLKNCHKIGEGVYGEVFLYRNTNGGTSVMKIIPIQGDQIVNGERQKKFEEIISEIVIAQELSDLRNNQKNSTSCFNEVYNIHCVKGKYPTKLLEYWDLYEESKGSENDCPDIFGEDQLYIVLELANGGQDLESFVFKNAQHAFSLFKQIVFSLAVAEASLQFEHRDLHWGNVLISHTRNPKEKISFNLNGRQVSMRSYNIKASIIDFTLSRITNDDICIFNDLSKDADLFNADGDYQFEIYRLMQKCNGNDWQQYKPYTNVLWLHYILDKMIHMVRYKSTTEKVHQEHIEKMKDLKDELFEYKSAEEFVIKNLM